MKIYLAGGDTQEFFNLLAEQGVKNILWSFYYLFYEHDVKNFRRFFGKYNPKDFDIFLDCGAFTAYTQGKKINLDQYINFIKINKEIFNVYSSLDDKNSFENTRDNLIKMEEVGIKPLAVYHLGEPRDYWEEICKSHNYVAIGGVAGNRKWSLEEQVREFSHLIDIAKLSGTKVHIFGFTSYQSLVKIPVYSVDSTSWLNGGKMGTIFLPDHRNRKILSYHYRDKELYRHKDFIEKCGVRYEDVAKSEGWKVRDIVNIKTYLEIEKALTKLYEDNKMRYWEEDMEESLKNQKEDSLRRRDKNLEKSPTRGIVQEIVKANPELEAKRLEKLRLSMTNFKTGKYSKNLPYYCNNCYAKGKCEFYQEPKEEGDKVLCALNKDFKSWFSPEDFNYREEEIVNESRNRLMNTLLTRAGFNLWAEIQDGGIQDRALTNLLFGIWDRLSNRPLFQQNIQININKILATQINQLDEESRNKIIDILEKATDRDESKGNIIPNKEPAV